MKVFEQLLLPVSANVSQAAFHTIKFYSVVLRWCSLHNFPRVQSSKLRFAEITNRQPAALQARLTQTAANLIFEKSFREVHKKRNT